MYCLTELRQPNPEQLRTRHAIPSIQAMRVIAGTYRSRPLQAPRGLHTRPTSDRLRETLFNVLAPRIEKARFADLYAGSGAVGIEALSRDAVSVTFVEREPAALASLRGNLAALKIQTGAFVEPRSVATALRALTRQNPRWDIVFLDPPYELDSEYTETLLLLAASADALLAPEAVVIAEHRRQMAAPLPGNYGALERYRLLEQGDAALSFFMTKR